MSYEISLGEDNGYLTPGFSWSFKTLTYFDPTQGRDRSGNDSDLAGARYRAKWGSNTFLGQPSYWLLDARLSYTTPDERFELTAWVRNLTDKVYTIDAFSSLEAEDRVVRVIGEPRTFGLTAWITF